MGIFDLIFPKTCLECKKDGGYICNKCMAKVELLNPVCPYCEKASVGGFTHTKCKKVNGLDGLTSVYRYGGVVRKAISSLKYKYATEIVQELCGYYVPKLEKLPLSVLVPVPIYKLKQNFRGFNQSELIGAVVAEKLGYKLIADLLVKNKPTKSQAGLSVKDRKNNLRDTFSLNPNYSLLPIHHSLVLFDDVFTTGSTLHEACKVLKRNGVEKVWGLTIAR